jgi:hypothetical protein
VLYKGGREEIENRLCFLPLRKIL